MARSLGVGLLLLLTAACARQQPALYASAAEQPAYAERYPAALATIRSGYVADEQRAATASSGFAKYPDALDKPDWPTVLAVVDEADHAGGTGDLANGMAETDAVRTFYGAEKESIHQKVAGSVEYAAKQKECDAELGGTAAGALDRSLDQAMDDRIHDHNPAIRMIEDNQDAIGKPNVDKLTKQVDQITLASYTVRVRLPQAKRNIDALLSEASSVKKTLEADEARAGTVLADPHASRPAKAIAQKRQATASTAIVALGSEQGEAKKLSDEMDYRTKTAQKTYDDALASLKKALDERANAAPKK